MRLKHLIVLILVFLIGCASQSGSAVENDVLVSSFNESLVSSNGIIDCSPGYVAIQTTGDGGIVTWQCIVLPDTPTPTSTPTLTPSPTLTNPPTQLPTPTATTTIGATATLVPTLTLSPTPTGTPVILSGQPCPSWVHDNYTALGPDGNSYPAWHPMVDEATGCHFRHSHGISNPADSSVNSSLPAFGYVGAVAGMVEPHPGFKVLNFECGDVNDDGYTSRMAARLVFHMGTSGLARYTMPHHSFQYDAMSCPGVTPAWELHLQGMANFENIGSICDNPRHAGRDFSTLGCVQPNSPELAYEIWATNFQVNYPGEFTGLWQSRAYISIVVAVFDPVTTVNPDNLNELIYTVNVVYPGQYNPLSANSPFRGLHIESYNGPISINNRNRPTSYVTDIHGNVLLNTPVGTPGTLVQYVSAVRVDGANSNASEIQQFKQDFDENNPYVIPPN